MTPSQLFHAANALIDCRLAGMVWGPPGIGKSEVIAQVAEHRAKRIKGYEMRDIRLGMMDPTDIKGFPAPDMAKGHMHWLPPNFLPKKGNGLLFFDELSTAPPMVQAAAYQLFLNRRVGDYVLPDGWDIMAAGNSLGDRAVAHRMSTALANRMVHLEAEVDLDEFVAHADKSGISDATISFVRFRPNLLHDFKPDAKGYAFPSPRSWFFADKLVRQSGLTGETLRQTLSGTVGTGAAGEYLAFLPVMRELPTKEDILATPKKVPVPNSPAVLHAIITMLERATSATNFGKFLDYVERVPREFQMTYVRASLARDRLVKDNPRYKEWAHKNVDLLT